MNKGYHFRERLRDNGGYFQRLLCMLYKLTNSVLIYF